MGHYASEMGPRTTLAETEASRNKERKKIEAELEKSPFKITDFRKGNFVFLRKKFNNNLNPGFAYHWDDLFSTELGISYEKIRELICAFKIISINKKDGKLTLKHNVGLWKTLGSSHACFEMDYRFMQVVKKRAA